MMKQVYLILFIICLTFPCLAQNVSQVADQKSKVVKPNSEYSESKSYRPQRKVLVKQSKRLKSKEKKLKKARKKNSTITNSSELVLFPFSVFDKKGKFVKDLEQNEIRVFQDNEEKPIRKFNFSKEPLTIVLAFDTSPSTESKITEMQEAAKFFVDKIDKQNQFMVVEFDSNIHVLTKATKNREEIKKGIEKTDSGGGTSIYDTLDKLQMKYLSKIEGQKIIVLFTDGVDTSSNKSDYEYSIYNAESSNNLVFSIYYNSYQKVMETLLKNRERERRIPNILPRERITSTIGMKPEYYILGIQYLVELSAATGGRVFAIEKKEDGVKAAFKSLANDINNLYFVGFNSEKNGKSKNIKLRVYRPDLTIRIRDKYSQPK